VPEYRDDILRELAELKRQVAQLAAQAQRREALTRASAGWIISNRQTPSTPQNGAHLYAASGRLMVRQSNGETFPIEPAPEIPFQPAAPVSDVPVFTSPADPGNTIASIRSAYQLLRTDCQSGIRANLIELKTSLRNAGILLG